MNILFLIFIITATVKTIFMNVVSIMVFQLILNLCIMNYNISHIFIKIHDLINEYDIISM